MSVSVIVLDVGRSMQLIQKDNNSKLEIAVRAIDMFIQHKMFRGQKDEVAIVLVGTSGTNNNLADENPGSYQHIEVAKDLQSPSLDIVRFVSHSIFPGAEEADILDAVIVAMDIIVSRCADMKRKPTKKEIFFFSDLHMRYDDMGGQIHAVVSGLEREEIVVKSIGHSEESFDDDTNGDITSDQSSECNVKREETAWSAMRHICRDSGGVMRTLAKAISLLSSYQRAEVKPATVFRGPLTIGTLKIPLIAVNRMQPAKSVTFRKVSPYAEEPSSLSTPGNIKVVDSYQTEDGQQIEKDDLIKGFRYGKEIVPWSTEEAAAMGCETERCLRLMCFVPMNTIPRIQFTGSKLVSFQSRKDDQQAAIALSALCTAMEEHRVYAVCRYVSRNKAAPQMYALWAHIKPDYEALLGVRLPYKEDFKEYTLPGYTTLPKMQPSSNQQATMDKFVEVMDLMTAWKDEDGDALEALQPKDTYNPVAQRIFQCIQHRALNPRDPLAVLDAGLKRYAEPHKSLWRTAEAEGSRLRKDFPVKEVQAMKKRKGDKTWEDEQNAAIGSENKRHRGTDTVAEILCAKSVTRVGEGSSILEDYNTLVNDQSTDNLADATAQLQQILINKMELYLGGSTDVGQCTFVACIQAMRSICLEADRADLYNPFCDMLKERIECKASHLALYKQQLALSKTSKISRVECGSSVIAPADAQLFVIEEHTSIQVVPPQPEEEEEDLEDL